jgi:hypothetical protein
VPGSEAFGFGRNGEFRKRRWRRHILDDWALSILPRGSSSIYQDRLTEWGAHRPILPAVNVEIGVRGATIDLPVAVPPNVRYDALEQHFVRRILSQGVLVWGLGHGLSVRPSGSSYKRTQFRQRERFQLRIRHP